MFLEMIIWLLIDVSKWNCTSGDFDEDKSNRYCSETEDWLGSIYGYLVMSALRAITKDFTWIMFAIALFRINRLLAKLKQFGFVNNTSVLRIHIILTVIQLIGMFFASTWSIIITFRSITEIEGGRAYTVSAAKIAENLIINRSIDFVNQIGFLALAYQLIKFHLNQKQCQ